MSLSVCVEPGAPIVWLSAGSDLADCVIKARFHLDDIPGESERTTRCGFILFSTGLPRSNEEEAEGVRFWAEQRGKFRRYFLAGANLTSTPYLSRPFEISDAKVDEIEISMSGRTGVVRVRGSAVTAHFSAHLFGGRVGIFNAKTSSKISVFSEVRLEPLPKPGLFPKGERRREKVPRVSETSTEAEVRQTMGLIARLGKMYNAACEGEERSSILDDRIRILEWIENLHRKLRDLTNMNSSQYFFFCFFHLILTQIVITYTNCKLLYPSGTTVTPYTLYIVITKREHYTTDHNNTTRDTHGITYITHFEHKL